MMKNSKKLEKIEKEKQATLDRLEAMEVEKNRLEKENHDIQEDFEAKVLAKASRTHWKPQ